MPDLFLQLRDIDTLFRDFYLWLAGQYDPQSGGFYYAHSSIGRLEYLPEKEKQAYLDAVVNFLAEKQDPETGMWGGGRPYIKISGVFKLMLFYRRFDIPLPRAQEILASLFQALRTDISEDMCWTRNSVEVLAALKYQISGIPRTDIAECFEITLKNLGRYLKADGGFSRHLESSMESPNEMPLGLGLAEGDMNAGTQALRVRNLCYGIVGEKAGPLGEFIGNFLDICMQASRHS